MQAERERGNKLAAEIRQEFEKEAILQRQKKLAEASQIKQTLADQILQKKVYQLGLLDHRADMIMFFK